MMQSLRKNKGDDFIVPEISQNEDRNESLIPGGGKYIPRTNPNPNCSEDFRYKKNRIAPRIERYLVFLPSFDFFLSN